MKETERNSNCEGKQKETETKKGIERNRNCEEQQKETKTMKKNRKKQIL